MKNDSILPVFIASASSSLCAALTGWIVFSISISHLHPNDPKKLQVIFTFLFFSLLALPLFLIHCLIYTSPFLLFIWFPLWQHRASLPTFWRWYVAPFVGATVCFGLWSVMTAIPELLPTIYSAAHYTDTGQLVTNPLPQQKIHIPTAAAVAAPVAGFIMFLVGSILQRNDRNA